MQLLDTLPVTAYHQQRRIALLVNQSTMMVLLAKLPEYYDLLIRYQAMAVGLHKPEILGAFYGRLGWCEWCFGAYDQAIHVSTRRRNSARPWGMRKMRRRRISSGSGAICIKAGYPLKPGQWVSVMY